LVHLSKGLADEARHCYSHIVIDKMHQGGTRLCTGIIPIMRFRSEEM
jgi:hypothetical protein